MEFSVNSRLNSTVWWIYRRGFYGFVIRLGRFFFIGVVGVLVVEFLLLWGEGEIDCRGYWNGIRNRGFLFLFLLRFLLKRRHWKDLPNY